MKTRLHECFVRSGDGIEGSVEEIRSLITTHPKWLQEREAVLPSELPNDCQIDFGATTTTDGVVHMTPFHRALCERNTPSEIIYLMAKSCPNLINMTITGVGIRKVPLCLAIENDFDKDVIQHIANETTGWGKKLTFSIIITSDHVSSSNKRYFLKYLYPTKKRPIKSKNVDSDPNFPSMPDIHKTQEQENGIVPILLGIEEWEMLIHCPNGSFSTMFDKKQQTLSEEDLEWLDVLDFLVINSVGVPEPLRVTLEEIRNKEQQQHQQIMEEYQDQAPNGTSAIQYVFLKETRSKFLSFYKLHAEYLYLLLHALCYMRVSPDLFIKIYLSLLRHVLKMYGKVRNSHDNLHDGSQEIEDANQKRNHLHPTSMTSMDEILLSDISNLSCLHGDNLIHSFLRGVSFFETRKCGHQWKKQSLSSPLSGSPTPSAKSLKRICNFWPGWLVQFNDTGLCPIHLACNENIVSDCFIHLLVDAYDTQGYAMVEFVKRARQKTDATNEGIGNIEKEILPTELNCSFLKSSGGQYPIHLAINNQNVYTSVDRCHALMGHICQKSRKKSRNQHDNRGEGGASSRTTTKATKTTKTTTRPDAPFHGEALLLGTKDPTTGLVPFLGAAAVPDKSLDLVYLLLRSDPSQLKHLFRS